jgi:hypothetical protein
MFAEGGNTAAMLLRRHDGWMGTRDPTMKGSRLATGDEGDSLDKLSRVVEMQDLYLEK